MQTQKSCTHTGKYFNRNIKLVSNTRNEGAGWNVRRVWITRRECWGEGYGVERVRQKESSALGSDVLGVSSHHSRLVSELQGGKGCKHILK